MNQEEKKNKTTPENLADELIFITNSYQVVSKGREKEQENEKLLLTAIFRLIFNESIYTGEKNISSAGTLLMKNKIEELDFIFEALPNSSKAKKEYSLFRQTAGSNSEKTKAKVAKRLHSLI